MRRHVSNRWFALAALAMGLAGCGGGGGGTEPLPGVLITKSAGGTVTVGNATVVIPANALAEDTRIVVKEQTTGLPTAPGGTQIMGGTSYDLSPNGLTFATNATLNMTFNPANVPAGVSESDLAVYTVVGGAWQAVPGGAVNTATHVATVPLAHFSVYAVLSPTPGDAAEFDVVDLGNTSEDTNVVPTALSSNGIVVGYTKTTGFGRGFIWQNGTMTQLPFFKEGDTHNEPFGVNASGVVVGECGQPNQDGAATMWSNGTVTRLKPNGAKVGWPYAINDNGDYAVGEFSKGPTGAVYAGTYAPYSDQFAAAYATNAMNASGKVAGAAIQPMIFDRGVVTKFAKVEGMVEESGTAISDNGILAGRAFTGTTYKGFFIKNGTTTFFETPTGLSPIITPAGVNNSGQIVSSAIVEGTAVAACLYENGVDTDLNTLIAPNAWHMDKAVAINNNGQILVQGSMGGVTHAFLLNPHTNPELRKRQD